MPLLLLPEDTPIQPVNGLLGLVDGGGGAVQPLPGEGEWSPTGRTVLGTPAVYTAFMRPDPIHTSLVAGFMWMDPKLLKAVHVPGLKEPAGAPQKYFDLSYYERALAALEGPR